MKRTRPVLRPGVAILVTGLMLAPGLGWTQDAAPTADASQVETLRNAVRTLTAETSELKDQLQALAQSVSEREQRISAADADVAARDVRIKALETDLATAQAATAAPESRAKTLEADLAAARAEAEASTARVKGLEGDLAAVRTGAEASATRVKALEPDLAAVRAEAEASAGRVKSLETDLAAVRAEAEASAARVKALEADVAAARANVEKLTAQSEAAAAATTGLEAHGREADAAVQQAKSQLSERDAQLQTMRADLLAAHNDLSSAQTQLALKVKENEALAAAGRELVAGEDTLAGQLAALKGGTADLQQELTATQAAALYGETRSQELEGELARLTGPDTVFFNQLRQALGPDSGAVIENDRFIFPADVAFQPASARLKPRARARALEIGRALATATAALPADLDWVIRIDGHTDRQSVGGRLFASNRELAAARALEVVDVLTKAGVPPERLVPAAFGEFRPLDPGDTPEAFQRNRRIELRLDDN